MGDPVPFLVPVEMTVHDRAEQPEKDVVDRCRTSAPPPLTDCQACYADDNADDDDPHGDTGEENDGMDDVHNIRGLVFLISFFVSRIVSRMTVAWILSFFKNVAQTFFTFTVEFAYDFRT